jgi:hypothetical protein
VEDGHGLLPVGHDVERVPDGLERGKRAAGSDCRKRNARFFR